MFDIIVIGGGAAGFFAAVTAKKSNPSLKVAIFEKTNALLSKVKVSGGGRCNVTHSCFEPERLVKNYPRGGKELLGPFHRFQPKDTIAWFQERGVELKTENDGRMFPVTDDSRTIIDCLMTEAMSLGVEIHKLKKIESIQKKENLFFLDSDVQAKKIILATGSNKDGHEWAKGLGHSIQDPVPSLFTFNIPQSELSELSGISFEKVAVSLPVTILKQTGPLLITHFGFSGPAVLKLSAWAAREIHSKNYNLKIAINWTPELNENQVLQTLKDVKNNAPQKTLFSENPFKFPKNFWRLFLEKNGISSTERLNNISYSSLEKLKNQLQEDIYQMEGKTTHKEEFVTCGGIALKEVNFKTMESKICPGLYFAGEVLDIDGVTGGFNFQSAWTTGFIAGSSAGIKG